jgi:hypothetical protein
MGDERQDLRQISRRHFAEVNSSEVKGIIRMAAAWPVGRNWSSDFFAASYLGGAVSEVLRKIVGYLRVLESGCMSA